MNKLPTGWLPRAAAAGRVAARIGRAAVVRAVHRADEADDRALGEALVAELDRLKGLSMKVGQILSTLETALPDGTAEILARLQRGVTPLEPAIIRAEIAAGLGAPLEDLFDAFDDVPVAAASIGQVHRAQVGGRDVAVKVRYPGVRAAIESDGRSIARIAALASLATAVDGRALSVELRARLLEECDFRREAAWLAAVEGRLAVQVPPVIADRSCESVLTTGWVEGDRLEALCGAPAARREAAAAALLRFTWTSLFGRGFLHADPHPGNFLFPAEGLVVLDWGCVRRFGPAEVEPTRRLLLALITGDRGAFPAALAATGAVPDPARFDMDAAWAMFRWMWAPYLDYSFTFTREWSLAGARFSGPGAPNQRTQGFPPAWVWLFRVAFGVHAVCVRLGVAVQARGLLQEALALSLDPLPDPVG